MHRHTRRTVPAGLGGLCAGAVGTGTVGANPSDFEEELATVRRATARYRSDIEAAKEDGWFVEGPFVPNMGTHYINPANEAESHSDLDISEPAVLVYDTGGSEPKLLAVEYLIHGDHTGHPPDIFSDEDADVKTSEDEGWEYIPPEDATGLHAWVWLENPEGVLHPTNPDAPSEPPE